jgi:hypothetical protein
LETEDSQGAEEAGTAAADYFQHVHVKVLE